MDAGDCLCLRNATLQRGYFGRSQAGAWRSQIYRIPARKSLIARFTAPGCSIVERWAACLMTTNLDSGIASAIVRAVSTEIIGSASPTITSDFSAMLGRSDV